MINGIVFDMDGLLLDTERLAAKASQSACRALGFEFPLEKFYAWAGHDQEYVARSLSEWTGQPINRDDFHKLWRSEYDALTAREIATRPTVLACLEHLKAAQMPMAIATTTERGHARVKLKKAGIAEYFAHIVGHFCVARRKPAPDPYLKAAMLLGLDPTTCAAFEDSDTGTRAALAAGMTVVQVPDIAEAKEKRAHHEVQNLWAGLEALSLA